jgi:GT2 family glycosyltransferase
MQNVSVVIPTYNRNKVLIDTINHLLKQSHPATEILIIDQTIKHEPDTENTLCNWGDKNIIRWFRLKIPSITIAMNFGLLKSISDIVLFLDDDIIPHHKLIESHIKAYEKTNSIWATVGQVFQPKESPLSTTYKSKNNHLLNFIDFHFNSENRSFVENVMAGNLSVLRKKALSIGGFDENYLPPVAYRFETDFAKRIIKSGGKILFEPKARINHLHISEGGTRTRGSHLCSASPIHGSGDYYYAIKQGYNYIEKFIYILKRPFREIRTKYHIKKPWCVPIKFVGEIRAFRKALSLIRSGPKYIQSLNAYDHLIR